MHGAVAGNLPSAPRHGVSRRAAVLMASTGLFVALPSRAQTIVLSKQREPSLNLDIGERVAKEAFRRAGVPLVLKPLPLPRGIEAANDGDTDGDLLRIADAAVRYPNLLLVPTPTMTIHVGVFGLSRDLEQMTRAQVADLRIGYTRGTLILQKYSRGLKATEAQSISATFEMLTQGRFDAMLASQLDGEQEIAARNMRDIVRWPYAWASEPVYVMLHRRHAALVPRIDAALQQMRKEGWIERQYLDSLRELHVKPLLTSPEWRAPPTPTR